MSKKPKGFVWSRKNGNIYIGWKCGDKSYSAQQFRYRANKSKKWNKKSVRGGTRSATLPYPFSNYYPNGKKVTSVSVKIRGKKGGKWSGWTSQTKKLSVPHKPTLEAALDDTLTNVTKFTWNTQVSQTDWRPFTNVLWQAVLLRESDITDTKEVEKLFATSAQDDENVLDRQENTGTAGDFKEITEDNNLLAGASYTRWFRVCSRGLAGASSWVYEKHVYARPNKAEIIPKETTAVQGASTIECLVKWKAEATPSHPIDQTTVQYLIAMPGEGMSFPSGTQMETANISADTEEKDAARFIIRDVLGDDECLFFAVNTLHDSNETPSDAYLALVGKLTKPDTLSYQTDNTAHTITITDVNNASEVSDSKLAIIYKSGSKPDEEVVVGIIPHGSSAPLETPVVCPDWSEETSFTIGVRAFVGTAVKNENIIGYSVDPQMVSDTYWVGGSVPVAPSEVVVDSSKIVGTAKVKWDWAWSDATYAQLSWTDHEDAWESTDEPEIYTVPKSRATQWNIAGLETGKEWHIAVRLANGNPETDEVIFSPWSTPVSITLDADAAVVMPTFMLSANAITKDGQLTGSWVYTASDNSEQVYAGIHEATISGNVIQYSEQAIAHAESEQEVAIDIESLGWDYGEVHNLAVQIKSASGKTSEWSNIASVTVAPSIEAHILSTTLITKPLVVDDEEEEVTDTFLCLDRLPLTITTSGGGDGVTSTLVIERTQDYEMDRPDESVVDGFNGEAVYINTEAESTITINREDLIGRLDDGATYKITLTMQDEYGQVASDTVDEFKVSWNHQAIALDEDSAIIAIDQTQGIARIIPVAPDGLSEGDTCDIYRLSADKPELIYEGAEFDTENGYVDPYPAIGDSGGYRLVYVTMYGDYIVGENDAPSWHDFKPSGAADEDYTTIDKFDTEYTIIDFDGNQLRLLYNIDTSDSWEKDIQETSYMGGSVVIDWNKAVKRSGTINGIILTVTDQEEIELLRRLAVYTGQCHVRTQSGSSYSANVNVSEDHEHEKYGTMASFSMSITRTDSQDMDGVTYEEWIQ